MCSINNGSLFPLKGSKFFLLSLIIEKENALIGFQPIRALILVEATGFEPATSASRTIGYEFRWNPF